MPRYAKDILRAYIKIQKITVANLYWNILKPCLQHSWAFCVCGQWGPQVLPSYLRWIQHAAPRTGNWKCKESQTKFPAVQKLSKTVKSPMQACLAAVLLVSGPKPHLGMRFYCCMKPPNSWERGSLCWTEAKSWPRPLWQTGDIVLKTILCMHNSFR